MFVPSPPLSALMLTALKQVLDGGRIYIYAGPVPATPEEALDMATKHTELCTLSLAGSSTGLTLAPPNGAVISKPAADEWSGVNAFDGAEASQSSLAPTFFRFCPNGDNGRTANGAPRFQGDVGGPASAASMKLGADVLANDGVSNTAVVIFNSRIGAGG